LVTRNLGAARDLDVQIDVLKSFRKNNVQREYKLGINHLLYHVRQKRRAIQGDVLRSLQKIERKGILQEMVLYLKESLPWRAADRIPRSSFVIHQAQAHILKQLDGLMAYRSCVNQKDADEELHQMRIAAKRLRYTMEIFSDLYDESFIDYIKAIKKTQKYLGEMHDCVMWLLYLPKFLKAEEKHIVRYAQAARRLQSIEKGVHYFEVDRKRYRIKRYRDFYEHWQQITADDMFGKLRNYLMEKTVDSKP
jgi:CHAD domain-containing protein